MSNKKKVNRRRRRSPWFKLFAKPGARLSARVTREEDWQTDVPNIKLSRAFVIVLVMHFVVIGAVTAFTMMNPEDAKAVAERAKVPGKAAAKGGAASKPADAPDTGAGRGAQAAAADKPADKPASAAAATKAQRADDMRRHIVHSGDSVAKIAKQYNVTPEEIYAHNRIDELYQLYQGRVLRIPVSTSVALPPDGNLFANPTRETAPPASVAAAPTPNPNGTNEVSSSGPRGATSASAPRDALAGADADDAGSPRTATGAHEPGEISLLNGKELADEPPLERPVVEVEDEPEPAVAAAAGGGGAPIVRPRAEAAQPAPAATGARSYTVVKGDNPFRIAQRFGVHYKDLLRANNISDPSKLQIGQTLVIPN